MDAAYHDEWARAIASGEAFIEGPYFRAPLYPWFLGAVYSLFGIDTLPPRILQAVIGSLSCGLLFLIGRRVFTRTIGAVAGNVIEHVVEEPDAGLVGVSAGLGGVQIELDFDVGLVGLAGDGRGACGHVFYVLSVCWYYWY